MGKTNGVRLTTRVRERAGKLLDMRYTPAELAEEIGVAVSTVRGSYLAHGAPHAKDEAGRTWIAGREFATWAAQQDHREAERVTLADGQGYCLRCRGPVLIASPHTERYGGNTVRISGTCPTCGRTVNRVAGRVTA